MDDKYKKTLENIILNLSNFYITDLSVKLKPEDIKLILDYLRDYYNTLPDFIPVSKSIVDGLDGSLDW